MRERGREKEKEREIEIELEWERQRERERGRQRDKECFTNFVFFLIHLFFKNWKLKNMTLEVFLHCPKSFYFLIIFSIHFFTFFYIFSMKSLHNVDPRIFGSEIDFARSDYELVMNKSIFDSNMVSKTNFPFFKNLGKIYDFYICRHVVMSFYSCFSFNIEF